MKLKLIVSILALSLFVACNNQPTESVPPIETSTVSDSLTLSKFKVWGNCNTCKETIEKSLQVKGATNADWNTDTKIMTVLYDTTLISLDQIEKNIAAAGYDNVKYRGNDNAYSQLPDCCQYQRKQ